MTSRSRCLFLAHQVYDAFLPNACPSSLFGPDVSDVHLISSPTCRCAVLFDKSLRSAAVVFRGSSGPRDFVTGFSAALQSLPCVQTYSRPFVHVHGGFLGSMRTCLEDIHQALEEILRRHGTRSVVVTGYSLGAAQALLCALELLLSPLGLSLEFRGIGCPRVGGLHLWEYVDALTAAGQFEWELLEHSTDIIPCLPPNHIRSVLTLGLNARFESNFSLLGLYKPLFLYTQPPEGPRRIVVDHPPPPCPPSPLLPDTRPSYTYTSGGDTSVLSLPSTVIRRLKESPLLSITTPFLSPSPVPSHASCTSIAVGTPLPSGKPERQITFYMSLPYLAIFYILSTYKLSSLLSGTSLSADIYRQYISPALQLGALLFAAFILYAALSFALLLTQAHTAHNAFSVYELDQLSPNATDQTAPKTTATDPEPTATVDDAIGTTKVGSVYLSASARSSGSLLLPAVRRYLTRAQAQGQAEEQEPRARMQSSKAEQAPVPGRRRGAGGPEGTGGSFSGSSTDLGLLLRVESEAAEAQMRPKVRESGDGGSKDGSGSGIRIRRKSTFKLYASEEDEN